MKSRFDEKALHSSKDITLEGALKIHRPKWQTVADLTLRAIGVEPSNPSEARASWIFLRQARFHEHTKVAWECSKVVLRLRMRQKV
jgi:hypothetical protein